MYAADFDYYRAGSLAEAGELLQKHPGAKLLAGGHSLIPLLKLRLAVPETVIDIGRITQLRGITVDGSAGVVRIGALTTHADLASSSAVKKHAAALAEAASQIGDPAVRNRGTVGGNVAHADPASDLPTVLTSLGATVRMSGPQGERSVAATDFFLGVMTTALSENEVLTAVEIPVAKARQGSAYEKFAHPASRYAVVGVAVSVTMDGGSCTEASVAVGGVVRAPVRAPSVETALVGQPLTADIIKTASRTVGGDLGNDADLLGDIFATAEYRKAVTHVWVERAVAAAAERAG